MTVYDFVLQTSVNSDVNDKS